MGGLARVRKRTVEECWSISVHDLLAHRGSQPFFRCPGHGESRTQERDLDLQAEYLADFPRELAPGCGKLQVRLYLVPEGERFACRHSGVRQSYERVCSEGD